MTVGRRVKIYGPAGRSPAMTSFRGEFWPGGQAGSSRLPSLQPLPRHPPPPQPDHTAGLWQLEFLSPLALGLPRRAGVAWKTSPPPTTAESGKARRGPLPAARLDDTVSLRVQSLRGEQWAAGEAGPPTPTPGPFPPWHPSPHCCGKEVH